jgi:excisionase family DNA binding protein
MSSAPQYLLTEPEVAQRLRVSVRTLQHWRLRGEGPPHFHAGRLVRYSLADINAWIAAHRHANCLEGHRVARAVRTGSGLERTT